MITIIKTELNKVKNLFNFSFVYIRILNLNVKNHLKFVGQIYILTLILFNSNLSK